MAVSDFSAAKGVRLGERDVKIPRTPAVYERKVKYRRYDEEDRIGEAAWKDNYKSAAENVEAIQKQFDAKRPWGCSFR